jgi:hypothetical protein
MIKKAIKPIIPVTISLALLIGVAVAILTTCSFADAKRPDRGSVHFGAEKKPEVKISGPMEGFKTVIADVAEKVVPTVVSVIPTKIDTVIFSNNPFYSFSAINSAGLMTSSGNSSPGSRDRGAVNRLFKKRSTGSRGLVPA